MIQTYPLPKLDDLQFVPRANQYEEKRQRFLELLARLAPGITQIQFEPAVESDALKRLTDDWQQRVWEAQLLADAVVREALQGEPFMLTSWKEMMRRFEGRGTEEQGTARGTKE
ncbi:MAG: hypothetical protein A2W31_09270 [Planctomycetes bacterium RBG_16_64_10]|nr:MAG: hypothetical protein A2W31_09270 [Planctomycetes bacterium RBG_16_64_10]